MLIYVTSHFATAT